MLNRFYDKFIFTNNLKWKNYNFFLVDFPFMIMPAHLIAGLAGQDAESQKKLYYAVRHSTLADMIPKMHVLEPKQRLEEKSREKSLIDFLEFFFTASGFGKIDSVQLDLEKKRAIVNVSSNPIAEQLRGETGKPADHFLRGILAGIYSSAFKEDMECIETQCAALGANKCVFVCQRHSELDYTKKETQEQTSPKV